MSPFVGSLLVRDSLLPLPARRAGLTPRVQALAVAGPLNDWLIRVMSKKNKDIFEPEFRLVPIALYLVTGGAGLFGFGYSLEAKAHYMVPSTC